MAGTYDFVIYSGEDFNRTLTWKDSTGTPIDVTGYTSSLSLGGTLNFITTTPTSNGQINLGTTFGTIQLIIPEAVCTTFIDTVVPYRLFMTNTVANTSCLLAGNFKVGS